MSFETLSPLPEELPLRGRRRPIALHESGVRHPTLSLFGGETLTPYREITHISVTPRAFRLGALDSVYSIPRHHFAGARAPEALQRALVERIRREPGGGDQLVRMTQVEVMARSARPLRAVTAVAALVVFAFMLQLLLGPIVELAGLFSRALVDAGEPWRLVTGNLLHGGFGHLALNMLALLGLGALVEWPLGARRALFIMLVSGFGAMGAGYVAGYESALGASGIVTGLAGAALWLELFNARWLPVGWRVPRRLFLGIIALQIAVELAAPVILPWVAHLVPGAQSPPMIASAAHAGGFVAGFLAAAALAGRDLRRPRAPRPLLAVNAALGLVVLLSLGAAGRDLASGPGSLARRAEWLLEMEGVPPVFLNNAAWSLATSSSSTQEEIEIAVRLARRAVQETDRSDPNVLDTLAEAQFQAGRTRAAVKTIEDAIALAPDEPYFREQRRRFLGERPADDRPAPPDEPLFRSPSEPPSQRRDEPLGDGPVIEV